MKYIARFVRALKSINFRDKFLRAKTEDDVYSVLCAEGMGFDVLRKMCALREMKKND